MSQAEAMDILKRAGNLSDAAKQSVEKVLGVQICDLSDNDNKKVLYVVESVRKKLGRLKESVKKRKIKLTSDQGNITFLKLSHYDELKSLALYNASSETGVCSVSCQTDHRDMTVNSVGCQTEPYEVPKATCYRKGLDLIKDTRTRNQRTKKGFDALKEFCQRNKVEIFQACGYFIHCHYYNTDKKLAALGQQLFSGNKDVSVTSLVSTEISLHIMERLRIGRGLWTNTRLLLLKYVTLPPYKNVSVLRLSLISSLLPYPFHSAQKTGVVVDLKESLILHLLRGIQYWPNFIPPCQCLDNCAAQTIQ